MPVNTRLQVRRGAAASWTSANPTLYAGEVGYETDSGRFKIGDGTTVWSSLDYNAVVPTGFLAGSGIGVSVAADGSTVTISSTNSIVDANTVTGLTEYIQDIIGLSGITPGSGIGINYNDSTGLTTISLSDPTIQVADITDLTSSATELNYLDGSIPGTGVAGKAVVLDSNFNISNLGTVSTTGTLTVGGNLIVNGTTTTVNSNVTTIDDPILTLGGDTAPGSDDNKDRGIEFRYYNGSAKVGFFGYDDSTGKFTFIPDATNSSEVFSGTKGEVDANVDWTNILNKPDPIVTVSLTGDVTGSGNATLTDLGNGTISIATTIGSNSVALGTDTTGNYVASVTNGSYITGGDGGSEGAALTLAVDATTTNTGGKVVARDASGNFAAGIVTASGLTGVSSNNPVVISYATIDGGSP
jgi:hypothetical protein